MKKTLSVITALIMLLLSLSGCSKDSFMDIYGFTHYYNKVTSGDEIRLEDYLLYEDTYSLVLRRDSEELHLALERDETGKISEIRLLAPKVDAKGNGKAIGEKERAFFNEKLKEVMLAYTLLNSEKCDEILMSMKLDSLSSFESEGELTLTAEDWHMVYYSNEIASVFMIFNIHLHPIEKTEKPESKPDFGNTAFTRKE